MSVHGIGARRREAQAQALADVLDVFRRERQAANDRARASNDPRKEGYAMAMTDAVNIIQGLARAVDQ